MGEAGAAEEATAARPLTCHGGAQLTRGGGARGGDDPRGSSCLAVRGGPPARAPAADNGPPADERSQTKKSIGRQPPPAGGRSRSRAGCRAAARSPRARPVRGSLGGLTTGDIADSASPF